MSYALGSFWSVFLPANSSVLGAEVIGARALLNGRGRSSAWLVAGK